MIENDKDEYISKEISTIFFKIIEIQRQKIYLYSNHGKVHEVIPKIYIAIESVVNVNLNSR